MKITVDSVKQIAVPILKKHDVVRASLFGSVVRGDMHTKSDVDFLIELPQIHKGFDYIGARMDLQDDLENALHTKVDLVEYHLVKKTLKKYILPEQLVIYQKNSQ